MGIVFAGIVIRLIFRFDLNVFFVSRILIKMERVEGMDQGVDLGVERKWEEAIGGRIERLEIGRISNLLVIGGKRNWLEIGIVTSLVI